MVASKHQFAINGNHFFLFQNSIFCSNSCILCEYLNINDLQKRRMSCFSYKNLHHFFCSGAVWTPQTAFFLCLCLRLIGRDLSLFRQNGKFEMSAFRRAEIRQNPPNSPFGDFGGHGNLQSCKWFIYSTFFEKSLFFSCFSNECKGEFCFTNHRPLSIFFDNQRVTK